MHEDLGFLVLSLDCKSAGVTGRLVCVAWIIWAVLHFRLRTSELKGIREFLGV